MKQTTIESGWWGGQEMIYIRERWGGGIRIESGWWCGQEMIYIRERWGGGIRITCDYSFNSCVDIFVQPYADHSTVL